MIQNTYILDSNVYGELVVESMAAEFIRRMKENKKLYFYGVNIVRGELVNAPLEPVGDGRLLRKAVLSVYWALIDEEVKLPPLAAYLGSQYFEEFCRLRESKKYERIVGVKALSKLRKYSGADLEVDFQLVGVASLLNIDVVVSQDARTILSPVAHDAYDGINSQNKLRTPLLVRYSDFKAGMLSYDGVGKHEKN